MNSSERYARNLREIPGSDEDELQAGAAEEMACFDVGFGAAWDLEQPFAWNGYGRQSATACCPRETIPDSCSCPDGCTCMCLDCECTWGDDGYDYGPED